MPATQIRAVTYQGLVNVVDAAVKEGFFARFVLLSSMGSELASFTGKLLNDIKGDLQNNQRDCESYAGNSGLDWSIRRGGALTIDGLGGRANIRITRLSLLRRVARPDFARAMIAAYDAPGASRQAFDVFNVPGPADKALTAQLSLLDRFSFGDGSRATLGQPAPGHSPCRRSIGGGAG